MEKKRIKAECRRTLQANACTIFITVKFNQQDIVKILKLFVGYIQIVAFHSGLKFDFGVLES